MNLSYIGFFLLGAAVSALSAETAYPGQNERVRSSGNQTWYINPDKGSDDHPGTAPDKPWKSAAPANRMLMSAGDTLVIYPGKHQSSLVLMGEGTRHSPITVNFMPGKHIFQHGGLVTGTPQISNTNDAPNEPKAMAIKLQGAKNIKLEGKPGASDIMLEGKAIFIVADHAENVKLTGLSFDYLHPTMGEFLVTKVDGNTMEAIVPKGTLYRIKDGRLTWYGPGWEFNLGGYAKVFDPKSGTFPGGFEGSFDPNGVVIEELSPGKLKITHTAHSRTMEVGGAYQNRNVRRDCCGFFQYRSKNIVWSNCNIYYMHGMGVVSQFSENLAFQKLKIEPRKGSRRTISSWADNLHFSGCKGHIVVDDCVLGSSHDDAVNVHGTHLRIIDQPAANKLRVKFMHNQTFGFDAFIPGDVIDYVSCDTLIPYASNIVTKVEPVNEKEIDLTLAKPNPENIKPNDAVENVTWTPSVQVKNTVSRHIPTRGFLLTTRRPVLIESCRFEKTGMPGILVEDDASGWYESGVVRDMTIANNTFIQCGEPVIQIIPHAARPEGEVHKNISIYGNTFDLKSGVAIRTRHTGNVKAEKNIFRKDGKAVPENQAVDIQ